MAWSLALGDLVSLAVWQHGACGRCPGEGCWESPAHGFSEVSRVSPGSRASVTEAHTGEGLVIRKMLRSKMWNLLIQGWVMRGSYSNVRRP